MAKTEVKQEPVDPTEERKKRADERLTRAYKLNMTPQQIAERLRKDVVGQDEAVEAVSVMLYQHIRTRVGRAYSGMPVVQPVRIPPILLIGPTGAGKTTLMRGLSRVSALPWVHCDASMATEAGWYGETPGVDWLRAALNAADMDPTLASLSLLLVDEIDKKAESSDMHSSISRAGGQDGMLRILEGGRHTIEMGEPGPGGTRRYAISMDSSRLLIVCAGAFAGLPDLIRRRLRGRRGVGFGSGGGADLADLSDDDVLRRVRPEDLVAYGLKSELVGRLASVIVMPSLSRQAMRKIATDTSDGPLRTLDHIAHQSGFDLAWPPALVDAIVDRAVESGLGARGMHMYASRACRKAFLEVPTLIAGDRRYRLEKPKVQLRSDSIVNGYFALIPAPQGKEREADAEAAAPPTRRARTARGG